MKNNQSQNHINTKLLTLVAFLLILSSSKIGKAQNIGINGTGVVADPSAILDVSSATLGILVPRVSLTAINVTAPITSPTLSLLVFNTATASTGTNAVSPGYYYWDGTKWVRFAYSASGSSALDWNILGNTGTNPTTNFLGTTDTQDLAFRTNNTETMRLRANGTLNIGYTDNTLFDFGHQLNVKNHMSLKRWNQAPNYVQTRYNGTESSLTPVLSGDAVGAITFEASDGGTNRPTIANIFAYAAENVSSSAAGGHLTFRTTALTTTTTFERMRITANGNVGINKIIPSAKFHVYNTFAGPTSDTSIYSEYLPQSSLGVTHYMASGVSSLATATNVGYGLDFNAYSFPNEYGLYFSGETKNYFSGNVGIGTITPQSKLDVNGIILAGDNTATQGNIMMASQYSGLSDLTALFGTEYSSGAPYIGYGVRTSTTSQGSFINTHSFTSISRGALVLGGAGGGNSSIFRFYGNTNQSLAFGATPVMNEYMTMKDNGFLGIGATSPTERLEVAGSVKIVDGTQGAGKVLTSDAAGKATWQVSSGSLLSTQNIPAQSIPPVATTGLAGFSYVIPASNDYRIEYRNWCGFTGGTVGDNVALHIRLLKNGVPVDEFENYTVLGTSRVMTLNIILHAANCSVGDVLSLDLRPGIPAGATSIDFNVGNPWTTSKVLVFPE